MHLKELFPIKSVTDDRYYGCGHCVFKVVLPDFGIGNIHISYFTVNGWVNVFSSYINGYNKNENEKQEDFINRICEENILKAYTIITYPYE